MVQMNRVRVVWTGVAGTPWYMNLYTLNGATTVQAALDAARAFIITCQGNARNDSVATIEGDVAQVESSTNQVVGVITGNPGAPIQGALTNPMPPYTQGLLRLLTGTFANGRQIRGRLFIPGAAEGSSDQGVPVLAYRTAIESAFTTYRTALGPSAVVFSRKNGTAVPISAHSMWTQWGVLRSRRD